jgi:OmpA-OmpF porin, OOP family
MRREVLSVSCLSLFVAAGGVSAQTDVPGAKDHPMVSRYTGSFAVDYLEKNFEGIDVPTGPVITTPQGRYAWKSAERAEGRYTRIRYGGPAGKNALEVFRNYQSALASAGFKTLYTCDLAACGDLSFHKFTSSDGVVAGNRAQEHFLSARLAGAEGTAIVLLYVTENRSSAPEGQPTGRRVGIGLPVVQLEILETKGMEGGLVTVDAGAMKKAIVETGRVALYGIHFDTGKAEIKAESKAALDEIGKLLRAERTLRVLVAGHTDTVGTLATNQELSMRRAQAVVEALVRDYGIDAKRLQPAGVGFASPVATNRKEAGRARNRRVELVEF